MELKKLFSQFAYRIEPKPEGGFIAHASDPSLPPLEAPSRQELLKLIQDRVFAGLATEFPGLKLPSDGTRQQFAFHVERTPEGGFSIHSADPNAAVIHGATENDLQSHFLEKLLNLAGKHVMPELAQALAAQGTGNLKVVVKRNFGSSFNPASSQQILGLASNPAPTEMNQSGQLESATLDGASLTSSDPKLAPSMIDNYPIAAEPSNFGKVFRLVPVFLLLGLVIYFLLRR